ncbi:MAG: Cof-type HAD-IIB family hydrolase [Enterococcus sp.]|nr:Cof-type HAD-IIB family hydrolase [Enterococcus sp.]
MSVELIAIDIDGTLLDSKNNIPEANKKALQNACMNGAHIVLASGRPITGVIPYINALELPKPAKYAISLNGGMINNLETGEKIISALLSYQDFLDLEKLKEFPGLYSHAVCEEGFYTTDRKIGHWSLYDAYETRTPVFPRKAEELIDMPIIKNTFTGDPDVLDKVWEWLPKKIFERFNVCRSAPIFIDVMPAGVNKGVALEKLTEMLNIDRGGVMSLGDADNDEGMLLAAGISVAMGNASDSLKKIAKHVTKSNDEAGLAWAIDKWS